MEAEDLGDGDGQEFDSIVIPLCAKHLFSTLHISLKTGPSPDQ